MNKPAILIAAVLLPAFAGMLLCRAPRPSSREGRTDSARPALAGTGRPQYIQAPNPFTAAPIRPHARLEEAPAWAVRYGKEFWRRASPRPITTTTGLPRSVDLGDIMERVSHAIRETTNSPSPQVQVRSYTATFHAEGMRFAPHVPDDESTFQPELRFRTIDIRRSGHALVHNGDRPWSLLGNTAQALLNADFGIIEHYEARDEGVEVAWILQRPPAGSGALTVEAELSGLSLAGETAHGWHFAGADGTPRVRIGKAKLIDATARAWDLVTLCDGNHLTISTPAAVLAQVTYPIAIDPMIGPEFGLDNPVGLPYSSGNDPAVGTCGDMALVAWVDSRDPSTGFVDIYATRIDVNGQPLDIGGIAVSRTPYQQYQPAVSGNGTHFLVAWLDLRPSPGIYAAIVARDGAVLGPTNGFPIIASTSATGQGPALASNGREFLAAWGDTRNDGSTDVYGARVTTNGTVLDVGGFPISMVFAYQSHPAIAAIGNDYFVVWTDDRNGALTASDIYGARVTGAGTVLDPGGIVINAASGPQSHPAIAANNIDYFVVWQDARPGVTVQDIYGARVSSVGLVFNPGGTPISTAADRQQFPTIAGNSSGFLAAWDDWRSSDSLYYAARINNAGVLLDANGINIARSRANINPDVTTLGNNYLVVYENGANFGIYAARVTPAGNRIDGGGYNVGLQSNRQMAPAIACSGTNFLAVWEDNRQTITGSNIYGARLALDGALLDPAGFEIASPFFGNQSQPDVAWHAGRYLVAWTDDRSGQADIHGRLYLGDGQGAGVLPICISTNVQLAPRVAGLGANFLVVWEDARHSSTNGFDIFGARVTPGGSLLDTTGIPISLRPADQRAPAVATAGTNRLVVWQDRRNSGLSGTDIYGARINANGIVLDTNGLAISTAPAEQLAPTVAATTNNFLVAWQDFRNGPINPMIYGARLAPSGAVFNPIGFPISESTAERDPIAASYENSYLVLWVHNGNSIQGARVTGAGAIIDASNLFLKDSPISLAPPSIAYAGQETFLVVSEGVGWTTNRAVGQFITFGGPAELQSVLRAGPNAILTWTACTGFVYRVQYKTNLTDPNWINLAGDVAAAADMANKTDTTLGNASRRFYRVITLP